MGLTGSNYTAFTDGGEPTADDQATGRWVAVDESGWDGEQLLARDRRYLVLSGVAIDDAGAADLLEALRRQTGLRSPSELKFRAFRSGGRSEMLRDLIGSPELVGRCTLYVADKEYCAVAKIVNLLEDQAYDAGKDLISNRAVRQMARDLFALGPRALGQAQFSDLLAAFVHMASSRGRADPDAAVEALFEEIELSWVRSTRRKVTEMLGALRTARPYAKALHETTDVLPDLEMLVPSLTRVVRWARPLGALRVLVDEQRALTDHVLELVATELRRPSTMSRSLGERAVDLRELVRGQSSTHASLQLADLVAGAGGLVVNTAVGADRHADTLRGAVIPLIDVTSLLPSEDLSPFS